MTVALIFCGHCGAQNLQSENFCFSCGHALATSNASASVLAAPVGQLSAQTLLKERYHVQRTIGQGGMGAVYLAQDTHLGDRLVAIKEMNQSNGQQAQEAVENFQREAHLLASLQHPNLPNIYDHFEENGRWYLVMSYIQGETLEEYLEKVDKHKLPLEETLRIGDALCDVLHYLHAHQPPIIFRDLKPGNIMRTPDGQIYLIDFGIARHFKPGQTRDTVSYGSMGYAPPEQYGKAQTTVRSDIYALGATLYECLSGYDPSQSPFRLPSLQSLVPAMSGPLSRLITQMLELDESKRPADVEIVRQRLQQAGSSIPSMTRQYTPVSPVSEKSSSQFKSLQSASSHSTSSASMQSQQIYRKPDSVEALPDQPLPTKLPSGEILSALGMLFAIAFAAFGLLVLLTAHVDSNNALNDVAIGQLFISLGAFVFFIARRNSGVTSQVKKTATVKRKFAGMAVMIAGVITASIGIATITPDNYNSAGAVIALLSIVIGLLIWVQ